MADLTLLFAAVDKAVTAAVHIQMMYQVLVQHQKRDQKYLYRYRYKLPLSYNKFEWNLNLIPNHWVKWKFRSVVISNLKVYILKYSRFFKEEIYQLLLFLNFFKCQWSNWLKSSPKLRFCIFLACLSFSFWHENLVNVFDHSSDYLFSVCTDIIIHLRTRYQWLLWWNRNCLTQMKLQWYISFIEQADDEEIIWRYINETLQQICWPTENQRLVYSDHKHHHRFKYQAIVTLNDLFFFVYSSIIDSRDNWFLFQESDLEIEINRLFDDLSDTERLYVYEDSAYTDSEATMNTYKKSREQELTAAQHEFNAIMTKTRIAVKHEFELTQNLWMKNSFHIMIRIEFTSIKVYYLAAVLMINLMICLQENQISQKFKCSPSFLKNYLKSVDENSLKFELNSSERIDCTQSSF